MRPEGPRQRRLTPFKLLTFILYGDFEFIHWSSTEIVTVQIGPMARLLGIPNYRIRDYLRWLAEFGYLENLELSYGKAISRIARPTPYKDLVI